ncbi:dihydroxyacetone kinase phosphoryl donor subunit DhaM [Thalassobacillus devorans]|uniref:dihydroxyacetone kinase phosphoryl donor subunit DhaM n=1 Tax=Thalassobacillus devorans TaxID=279813 RepID=UPI00049070F0|nr:dihydroxyacetone kinase phosphoryl donor subunit DhaM [Thalassobacillus devorans]
MANVGIVVISHSEKAAEGIKEIVDQAVGKVAVEAAGGLEDGEIGTSLEKIQAAIQHVHNDQGVVMFYDLGSAKMNAEMAIEMLELENVHLAEAPVLEGAYLAAVEASMGKSLKEIVKALEKEF